MSMSFQSHSMGVSKGNVSRPTQSRATSKVRRAINSRLRANNEGSRVPTSRKKDQSHCRRRALLSQLRCQRCHNGTEIRFKPSKTTEGCECSVAAFDDEPHRIAPEVGVP